MISSHRVKANLLYIFKIKLKELNLFFLKRKKKKTHFCKQRSFYRLTYSSIYFIVIFREEGEIFYFLTILFLKVHIERHLKINNIHTLINTNVNCLFE